MSETDKINDLLTTMKDIRNQNAKTATDRIRDLFSVITVILAAVLFVILIAFNVITFHERRSLDVTSAISYCEMESKHALKEEVHICGYDLRQCQEDFQACYLKTGKEVQP